MPVLKVFKEELITKEKLFVSESNADLFTALSIWTGTNVFKEDQIFYVYFAIKNHKSQSSKIATHIKTRRNILKDNKCCFFSLQVEHISKNCMGKIKCH